ncbi:MAG TPA: hypothetical protein PL155_02665 [Candidatus Omnitrophota bacterium]|nr:hypothetical protein [Candidatus Omnitrophota bacterium]HPD84611.1 hypothetical protein [Candidatus Omnitrophota bacterium]HRZ03469.1 hypothetical protein [Candidatus Omnitrophota bacterium]
MEENKSPIPESSQEALPIKIDDLVKKMAGRENSPADDPPTSQGLQKNSDKAPLDNLKSILSTVDANAPRKDIVKTITVRSNQSDSIKEKSGNVSPVAASPSGGHILRKSVASAIDTVLAKPSDTFAKQEVVMILQELLKEAERTTVSLVESAPVERGIDSAAVKQLEELIHSRTLSAPGAAKNPEL